MKTIPAVSLCGNGFRISNFELPERQLESLRAESEFEKALKGAKSFRQMRNIIAEYKMKTGTPEPQARLEAASEVDQLLDAARKQLKKVLNRSLRGRDVEINFG